MCIIQDDSSHFLKDSNRLIWTAALSLPSVADGTHLCISITEYNAWYSRYVLNNMSEQILSKGKFLP